MDRLDVRPTKWWASAKNNFYNFIPDVKFFFLKVPIMTGQVMKPLLTYDIEIT